MSSQQCRFYPNCSNKYCQFYHPPVGKVPCSFWQRGLCTKGDRCHFLHVSKESTVAASGMQVHNINPVDLVKGAFASNGEQQADTPLNNDQTQAAQESKQATALAAVLEQQAKGNQQSAAIAQQQKQSTEDPSLKPALAPTIAQMPIPSAQLVPAALQQKAQQAQQPQKSAIMNNNLVSSSVQSKILTGPSNITSSEQPKIPQMQADPQKQMMGMMQQQQPPINAIQPPGSLVASGGGVNNFNLSSSIFQPMPAGMMHFPSLIPGGKSKIGQIPMVPQISGVVPQTQQSVLNFQPASMNPQPQQQLQQQQQQKQQAPPQQQQAQDKPSSQTVKLGSDPNQILELLEKQKKDALANKQAELQKKREELMKRKAAQEQKKKNNKKNQQQTQQQNGRDSSTSSAQASQQAQQQSKKPSQQQSQQQSKQPPQQMQQQTPQQQTQMPFQQPNSNTMEQTLNLQGVQTRSRKNSVQKQDLTQQQVALTQAQQQQPFIHQNKPQPQQVPQPPVQQVQQSQVQPQANQGGQITSDRAMKDETQAAAYPLTQISKHLEDKLPEQTLFASQQTISNPKDTTFAQFKPNVAPQQQPVVMTQPTKVVPLIQVQPVVDITPKPAPVQQIKAPIPTVVATNKPIVQNFVSVKPQIIAPQTAVVPQITAKVSLAQQDVSITSSQQPALPQQPVKVDQQKPLVSVTYAEKVALQAKLLRENEFEVIKKLTMIIQAKSGTAQQKELQIGVKRARDQTDADLIATSNDNKRQKTSEDTKVNPEAKKLISTNVSSQIAPSMLVVGMAQTTQVRGEQQKIGHQPPMVEQQNLTIKSAEELQKQGSAPGLSSDVNATATNNASAPQTTQQAVVAPPAVQPEPRRKMTVKDIENDLVEFNKKLDALEKMFEIAQRPFNEQKSDAILSNPHVDHLISFETKVMYFTNYFETKHGEIMAAKQ